MNESEFNSPVTGFPLPRLEQHTKGSSRFSFFLKHMFFEVLFSNRNDGGLQLVF